MGLGNLSRKDEREKPDEATLGIFQEVGYVLAGARKEANLTIKQVASKIHIRQQYLIDLEEGRLEELPGRVYVLGFIRTYARFLNLDGEELVRRLSVLPNLPQHDRNNILFPLPTEEGPTFPVLFISAGLVIILSLGGYFFLKPSQDIPAIEANPTALPEPKASPPDPEGTTESTSTLLEEIPQPIEQPSFPPQISSAIPPVTPQKVVLKAKEPSWVEIRDAQGQVIFMKVLQRGEEYTVPDKPGIVINTGNAGGIDIFVGEIKLPPLGEHGHVKRGIRLESLQ